MAMRVYRAGLFVAALVMVGLVPASMTQARPAAQMPGSIPEFVWTLTDFPGVVAIAEPRYTIQFLADGTVGIGADCNRAGGTWSGGDDALEIAVTMQTLAACPADSLEQPYLTALDGVTGYTLNGTTLVLHSAAGDMTFTV
jgi:heat shock protein HslJ